MRAAKIIFVILAIAVLVVGFFFIKTELARRTEIAWDQSVAEEYGQIIAIDDLTNAQQSNNMDGSLSGDSAEEQPGGDPEMNGLLPAFPLWAIDLEALQEKNSDAIGWIWMPDTEINYPVVQGYNNSYYLTHRFDDSYSSEGAIYADYRCDLDGKNVILYGHNTSSGKFDSLNKYLTQGKSYWDEHPYFIYYSDDCPAGAIYDIFSVFKADVSTTAKQQALYVLPTDDTYAAYIDKLLGRSNFDTGVEIDYNGRMLMLSTCCYSGNKRCIVCASKRCTVPEYISYWRTWLEEGE